MKMTLSKKLYGITGFVLVILVLLSVISYFSQHAILQGYKDLEEVDQAQLDAAREAQNQIGHAVMAFKNHLIRGDEGNVVEFRNRIKAISDQFDAWERFADKDEEHEAIKATRAKLDAFDHFIDPVIEARKTSRDIIAIDRTLPGGIISGLRESIDKMEAISAKNLAQKKEQVAKNAARVEIIMIVLAVLAIVTGITLSAIAIKGILKSVGEVEKATGLASQGNLSQEVVVRTGDEIGRMATSFNQMIVNVRRIVGEINQSTGSLASSSEELSATSDDMHKGANELSSQIEQVVTAMTEVSQTIMDMARNASSAADASKNAADTAKKGKEIVDTNAEDMVRIAQTVQAAAGTIEELGKSSAQIGEIVAVINGIADQTNLLALNAAIEAARAGEQGRGFAVVADEVRKLAERTGQATKDITQRIASIQTAAGESVNAMKQGRDEVDKGVKLAREASASLDSIVRASTDATDMVQRIAAATEQQSAATEEVSQNMEHIAGITKQTASSTDQIKVSAAELARLAASLKEMAAWFQV